LGIITKPKLKHTTVGLESDGLHVGETIETPGAEAEGVNVGKQAPVSDTQDVEAHGVECDPRYRSGPIRPIRKPTIGLNSGHRTKNVCVVTKKPRVASNRITCRTKKVEKAKIKMIFLNKQLSRTKKDLSVAMERIKILEARVKELEGAGAKDDELAAKGVEVVAPVGVISVEQS
jgi:hypothetical protein